MNKYLERLREGTPDAALISKIIDDHKADHDRMLSFYQRYKAAIDGVPIFNRQAVDYEDFETGAIKRLDNKVNNTLNNSFDSDIVDTKQGYMFGHPITYQVDDGSEPGESSELQEMLNKFNLRNHVEDSDSEWGKKAAICGYSSRLAYIDTEKNERIRNIDPWETVFFGDEGMTEPEFALRYYYGYRNQLKAEFYDSKNIYFFDTPENGNFGLQKEQPHLFDYCPLFGLPNNEELMGDAEKVYQLIDAYDRTLSDASNEIEQYRLAYLILKGLGADEETLQELKQTGIMQLFDEKDDVSYLTKDINDALIEHHLDRLEANILRFAKSVNFTDESFAGNISGVAMKFKIMALENKCITMERKMTAALRYQAKVIFSAWRKRHSFIGADDFLKVWFQFKRNLPVNTVEEAQVLATLQGVVSEKTRLATASFIDDVDYELAEMKREQEERDEYLNNQYPIEGDDYDADAEGD
ncbi:phage portal protein [Terribacillus sp. 179-K 1B1 HS]|uniref:phage portal protein n=1 Tax=Terribacillus sp. 179-K 1B1 HS TaxID=3142388 RepID=UPI0039A0A6F6